LTGEDEEEVFFSVPFFRAKDSGFGRCILMELRQGDE